MFTRSLALFAGLLLAVFGLAACEDLPETVMETPPSRLEAMRERGSMTCASHANFPGFGFLDGNGNYRGFDIDLCRDVAAAVFGDPEAIEVQPMTFAERGPALQAGETDLVTLTTTWTIGREARWGDFAAIMFYNGQAFMVRRDAGFESALDLDGTTVCVTGSTTTELNLADFFRRTDWNWRRWSLKTGRRCIRPTRRAGVTL